MASADFSQFVVTTAFFFECRLLPAAHSVCEISLGTHTFFPTYTRHVYRKRFRAAIGFWLAQQSHPRLRPDMISVRRARVLPLKELFILQIRLPSDSASRRTPLPLAMTFPLPGGLGTFTR